MTAIVRMESRNLARGTLVLTGVFGLLVVFMLAVFPGMAAEAETIEGAFPEHVAGLFGFEELHTLEGFLGSYMFPFIWTLFLGIYFAYLGGGMIAGDIRERRMDLLLSNPVSRESVVLQKIGAIWVPLVAINVGLFVLLYAGSFVLEESIDPVVLAMAHLLSVPYLLVCAAIGVVMSVVLDRVASAQAASLGAVFLLWLLDGLSEMDPDLEWVGGLTPSRYYDPAAILIHEEYALGDAAVLLVTFVVLLAIATGYFVRRDI